MTAYDREPAPGYPSPEAPAVPAPPAEAAPPATFTYDHALRAAPAWWRGAVAIVLLVVGFLVLSVVLGGLGVLVDLATGAYTLDQLARGEITLTPWSMLANNLSLAALWPIAMLLQWWLFGVRPGWMSSVEGRFRWRWVGRLALVIVPAWAVYVGVSFLFSPIDAVVLDGTVIAMVLVVILTTPLQSAGEEFGARGLIQRSVGSWFAHPVVAFVAGAIISGAIFASAHLAGDPWLIAYYFVFGVSLSFAARGTGGLEAPVLIHATNNVLLLVPTALMSQTDSVFQREAGVAGPYMLLPMAVCVAAALFSTWWARRNRVVTRAPLPPTGARSR
ncbi:membrane protease YdiL (CAAX protease family) [Labedella gwakjiensis]|uniref:CPBP family intramembrane metalloprotease n=1 Tax=Labedella gwakjiensis TaxID=390269 RepID=A0A2P8GSW0_9MICO|nr:CPBP family intramembrane glutamic endopeptidase [Labedella gwakjiensis]PSL37044.1 membrane protease YdiL (CAAX protease family) [Labedella gwakjiensis]RUQ82044.1 CPBP family intramembrane metalloprotease [Labedella gwakjiensis]